MFNLDNFLDEEFFIMDSNNVESFQTKLYGYLISPNGIITNQNMDKDIAITPDGAYIFIKRENNHLTIYQDYLGSYGLYIYRDDDYFCISNSFVKMLEYLSNHEMNLSLNNSRGYALLSSELTSFSYRQTLINEIEEISSNCILKINLDTLDLSYEFVDYQEHSLDLNSKEAIEILDDWYKRWVNLFYHLKQKTNDITVDISGGFDSRAVLALILSSDIPLDEISFHSINDNLHTHKEDYEISTQIAKGFDFKLNDTSKLNSSTYYYNDVEVPIAISLYTKLSFHNQMYWKFFKLNNPRYTITGAGGELIRSSSQSPQSIIEKAEKISYDSGNSTKQVMQDNLEYLEKGSYDEIGHLLYRNTRARYHFGKGAVENYFANIFGLNPLMDANLNKLKTYSKDCKDNKLLITLIYVRYCPKLLDFKFDKGRKIKDSTIDFARTLSRNYPLEQVNINDNYSDIKCSKSSNECLIKREDIDEYLKNIFLNNEFKRSFEEDFSSKYYVNSAAYMEEEKFFPLQKIFPLLSLVYVNTLIKKSKGIDIPFNTIMGWLGSYKQEKINIPFNYSNIKQLNNYITARIDLRYDINCVIDLMGIEGDNVVYTSKWLKNTNGMVIESNRGKLDFSIKSNKKTNLIINLKSLDLRDKNNNRFPVYIDYTLFSLNDEIIFNSHKLLSHDKGYVYEKLINEDEKLDIHIEWKAFNRESVFDDEFLIKNYIKNKLGKYKRHIKSTLKKIIKRK